LNVLAGDVGGTKVHLGLFRLDPDRTRPVPVAIETFASGSASGLEQLVEVFIERHPAPIGAACLGVAGPVVDGLCRATNLPWLISERSLADRFGWDRVALVNDLQAMASAVALLDASELVDLNDATGDPAGNRVVIAPGTGLGQALLIADGHGGWLPVASEGGHCDLAPRTRLEIDLALHLERRYGHASYERVVSGRGIGEILGFLLSSRGLERPSWLAGEDLNSPGAAVSRAALAEAGDPLAVEVLEIFVRCLAGAAGNLALTVLASGGVYIGGGIPPKILPLLTTGSFMEAFTDKGRFGSLLGSMPVRVILNQRSALLGAARLAGDLARGH
jgi:glucokinase